MNDLLVRLVNESDKKEVTKLWSVCSRQLGRPMMPSTLNESLFVAVIGSIFVGFVKFNHGKRVKHSSIYELAVHPSYRRHGVGVALVNAVQSSSPHGVVFLKCLADNPACLFYTRIGFLEVGKSSARTGVFMRHFERRSDANMHKTT